MMIFQSKINICIWEMHKQTCVECAIKTLCGHTMEAFLVKHTNYFFAFNEQIVQKIRGISSNVCKFTKLWITKFHVIVSSTLNMIKILSLLQILKYGTKFKNSICRIVIYWYSKSMEKVVIMINRFCCYNNE